MSNVLRPKWHQTPTRPERPIRTRIDWIGVLMVIMFVITLTGAYSLAAAWDAKAEAEDQLVMQQLRFAAERAEAERATDRRLHGAYMAGQQAATRVMSERARITDEPGCNRPAPQAGQRVAKASNKQGGA